MPFPPGYWEDENAKKVINLLISHALNMPVGPENNWPQRFLPVHRGVQGRTIPAAWVSNQFRPLVSVSSLMLISRKFRDHTTTILYERGSVSLSHCLYAPEMVDRLQELALMDLVRNLTILPWPTALPGQIEQCMGQFIGLRRLHIGSDSGPFSENTAQELIEGLDRFSSLEELTVGVKSGTINLEYFSHISPNLTDMDDIGGKFQNLQRLTLSGVFEADITAEMVTRALSEQQLPALKSLILDSVAVRERPGYVASMNDFIILPEAIMGMKPLHEFIYTNTEMCKCCTGDRHVKYFPFTVGHWHALRKRHMPTLRVLDMNYYGVFEHSNSEAEMNLLMNGLDGQLLQLAMTYLTNGRFYRVSIPQAEITFSYGVYHDALEYPGGWVEGRVRGQPCGKDVTRNN